MRLHAFSDLIFRAAADASGGSPAPAAAGGAAAGAGAAVLPAAASPAAVAPAADQAAASAPAETAPKSGGDEPAKTALTSDAPKAPEPVTYADFKLPEHIAKDDATLAAFTGAASKLGISQEHAQSILDAVAPALKASADAARASWDKLNAEWQDVVKKDFAGPAFDAMKTHVGRAFDEFVGTAESAERKALNEALLLTGAGNNPHIVRLIARMAEALGEGTPVHGRAPGSATRDVAATMYPTHTAKNE